MFKIRRFNGNTNEGYGLNIHFLSHSFQEFNGIFWCVVAAFFFLQLSKLISVMVKNDDESKKNVWSDWVYNMSLILYRLILLCAFVFTLFLIWFIWKITNSNKSLRKNFFKFFLRYSKSLKFDNKIPKHSFHAAMFRRKRPYTSCF